MHGMLFIIVPNRGADPRAQRMGAGRRPDHSRRAQSGPVPCSGARSAAGQGTGRSQRRDSARRSRAEQVIEWFLVISRKAKGYARS